MAYDAGHLLARMTLDAKNFKSEIEGSKEKISKLEKATKVAGAALKVFAGIGAATTAAMTALAVSSFKTAAQFETYAFQLRAVSDSTEQAVQSMKQIREFAERTPFYTDQVVQAFVQLKAVGIDATESVMETIGNVAFTMNRDIRDVASGLISFETEVLRRLGIQIDRTGEKAVIQSGKIRIETDKTAEAIRAGLLEVWGERFPDAMKKAEETWKGLSAIMASGWQEFRATLGEAILPSMKELLKEGIIPVIDNMREWVEANQTLIQSQFDVWIRDIIPIVKEAGMWVIKFADAITKISQTITESIIPWSAGRDEIRQFQIAIKETEHEIYKLEESIKKAEQVRGIPGLGKLLQPTKEIERLRSDLEDAKARLFAYQQHLEQLVKTQAEHTSETRKETGALVNLSDQAIVPVTQNTEVLTERLAALNSMMRTNHGEAAKLAIDVEILDERWMALHDMGRDANKEITEGIQEQSGIMQTLSDDIQQVAVGFTQGLGGAIADLIVSGKSFGDVMKGVLKALIADLVKAIIQATILKAILSSIKGPFGFFFHQGGLVMHEGGLVLPKVAIPQLPRAHSGLSVGADEVPIIAQRGEGVLSRDRGMPAIGGPGGLAMANLGIPPTPSVQVVVQGNVIAEDDWIEDKLIPGITDAMRRDIGWQTGFERK